MFLRDFDKAKTYEDFLELGFTESYASAFAEDYAKGFAIGYAQGFLGSSRNTVLSIGRRRFGPSAAADTAVAAITDQDRLDRIIDRLPDAAAGWPDLLATP